MRPLIAVLAAALLVGGCGAVPGASPTDAPGVPSPSTLPPDSTIPPDLTLPPEVSIPPDLGDIPDELYIEAAQQAAAAAGATLDQVELVRAEQVTWSDGALGCPEPGQMYTQALVPGFWLVLEVGDQEFDFRASEGGQLKLCPPGQGEPPIEDQ